MAISDLQNSLCYSRLFSEVGNLEALLFRDTVIYFIVISTRFFFVGYKSEDVCWSLTLEVQSKL